MAGSRAVLGIARPARRSFSTTTARCSHIGRAALTIPPDVDLRLLSLPAQSKEASRNRAVPTVRNRSTVPAVQVKGPLGELSMELPAFIKVDYNSNTRKASVGIEDRKEKVQRAMWGTTRAYLQNHVTGVSEGHICILRLVGVGYRAVIEPKATTVASKYDGQQFVSLKVGYSHPIELGVPFGVKASTPQPTRILLEGIEKEVVKQFAAKIRKWRVPEPYKGKGIFVDDETIKLKAKKIK
ncbi:MAG: hypothetical protein M1831_004079 [Alyxoria varia]|nr:MAG: hypothetical protein M1831_004079 [Alyxoria varia]